MEWIYLHDNFIDIFVLFPVMPSVLHKQWSLNTIPTLIYYGKIFELLYPQSTLIKVKNRDWDSYPKIIGYNG
jgi:hypothetical protein